MGLSNQMQFQRSITLVQLIVHERKLLIKQRNVCNIQLLTFVNYPNVTSLKTHTYLAVFAKHAQLARWISTALLVAPSSLCIALPVAEIPSSPPGANAMVDIFYLMS